MNGICNFIIFKQFVLLETQLFPSCNIDQNKTKLYAKFIQFGKQETPNPMQALHECYLQVYLRPNNVLSIIQINLDKLICKSYIVQIVYNVSLTCSTLVFVETCPKGKINNYPSSKMQHFHSACMDKPSLSMDAMQNPHNFNKFLCTTKLIISTSV